MSDTTSVAPPEVFRSSLTSHQNPSFLAPLGHLIEPDGPSGVIGGLASPAGSPVPYEGAAELRVPERATGTHAPVAQRQLATLRPAASAVPAEPAPRPAATPEPEWGTARVDSADEPLTPSAPLLDSSAALLPPVDPAPPADPAPAVDPAPAIDRGPELVVARQADPVASPLVTPTTAAPAVEAASTLGAPDSSSAAPETGPAGSPSVRATSPVATSEMGAAEPASASAPAPAPTPPLAVPVQRSVETRADATTPRTTGPGPRSSLSVPPASLDAPVQRTSVAPPPAVDPPAPADLVVARSATSDPPSPPSHPTASTAGALDQSRTHDLAGSVDTPPADQTASLLADRPPLVQRSTADESLPVAEPEATPPAGATAPVTAPTTAGSPSAAPTPVAQRRAAEAGGPPAPATLSPTGSTPQTDYPPLVARSVQRRPADPGSASSEGVTQAPLSGFAAAISTLQTDAGGPGPSHDRTGMPIGEPAAATDPRPIDDGVAAASISGAAGPVVARRVAPDGGGRLPVAAARLEPVQRWSATPASAVTALPMVSSTPASSSAAAAVSGGRPLVQRSLLADSPPLVPVAAVPMAGSAPTSVPPSVQRLAYGGPDHGSDDHGGGTGIGGDPAPLDHDIVATTTVPDWSDTAPGIPMQPAPAASWSPPTLSPAAPLGSASGSPLTPSGPSLQRAVARSTGDSQIPPLPLQRAADPASTHPLGVESASISSLTDLRIPSQNAAISAPLEGAAVVTPSIQRQVDPSAAGNAAARYPAGAADQPAVAVSSRTVGLAELFAMAAAQGPADAVVQRLDADPAPSSPTPPPAVTVQTAPTPAPAPATPAAPGGAPQPSAAELEEMARRLYEPLSSRLRAELWQDRERSGLLTDLRP